MKLPVLQINRVFHSPVRRQAAVYVVLVVLLLGNRLTSILHAESSAVVTLVAFFAIGITSLPAMERGEAVTKVLGQAFAGLLVPLGLLSATALWIPNCDYWTGLSIYLLFVIPTAMLATAVAATLVARKFRYPKLILIAVGFVVAIVPTLTTLKFFPQFFVYNHIFGGLLGPVYEEQLVVRTGFIWYRTLTVAWGLLLFSLASSGRRLWLSGCLTLGIGCLYLLAGSLGMRGSTTQISNALGSVIETEHFRIHFNESGIGDRTPESLARYHEYHFARLSTLLDVRPVRKVDVFIYPDAEIKAELTGAGTTSVAPVWLSHPQIHILDDELSRSLDHELVHVFSREFGDPVTNATFEIGLVEGIAVGLEAPDGMPDLDAQVQLLFTDSVYASVYDDTRLSQIVASPLFWLDRGAVSYAISGSFIRWLLREYPVDSFKRVYRSGDYRSEYGVPVQDLLSMWKSSIVARPKDPEALRLGSAQFSIPSLFEKRCPHYIPAYVRTYRQGRDAHLDGDLLTARAEYASALDMRPDFTQARAELARVLLQSGNVSAALEIVSDEDEQLFSLLEVKADVFLSVGQFGSAAAIYSDLIDSLPAYAVQYAYRLGVKRHLADRSQPSLSVFRTEYEPEYFNELSDTTRVYAILGRALEKIRYDPENSIMLLESALLIDSTIVSGEASGQLAVLQFWRGDFVRAAEAATLAIDYFQRNRNDAQAEYYEYIFNLSSSENGESKAYH